MAGERPSLCLAAGQRLDGIGMRRGLGLLDQRQGVAGTVGAAGLDQDLGHGDDVAWLLEAVVSRARSGGAIHGKIAG